MKNSKYYKWIILAFICLGGGIIYVLPYLQYSFYDPLIKGLNITNEQLGTLMSVYGTVNIAAYLFGGMLADRVSYKLLIPVSLIVTGLAGFWFSTYPSYGELIIIHIIWSLTTVFAYWPAMIKAVKLLGSSDEQGRLFGLREAGFSFFAFVFSTIGLLIFNSTGENLASLLVFYSSVYVVMGIASFFLLPKDTTIGTEKKEPMLQGFGYVLRQPGIWLVSLMMFCAYAITAGSGRIVPYLTSVFNVSASLAAFIGILRTYVIAYLGAAAAGFVVDKIKSAGKYMEVVFIIIALTLIVMVIIPGTPSMLAIVLIVGLGSSLFILSMRGIYWVPLDKVDIPKHYLGTAIGVISAIAYLPDAFIFTVYGKVMDKYSAAPVVGFKIIFGSMIGLAVVGLIFTLIFNNYVKKSEKAAIEENRAV